TDGIVEHEMRDRIDQAELDCEPYKGDGQLQIAVFVAPAYQRLEPDYLPIANIHFGLESAAETPVANRQPQPLFLRHPVLDAFPDRPAEKSSRALGLALDAVHGSVGISAQLFKSSAVLRVLANSY